METPIAVTDPVKNFVANNSRCAEIFAELKIDFCCGGDQPLLSACEENNLEPDKVYQRLMALPAEASTYEEDVSGMSTTELTHHIESTHHVYLQEALPRLSALMDKVQQAHSSRHPELVQLQAVFKGVREDLEPHLMKEERILFPLIRSMELDSQGLQAGAAQGPIRMMRHEHDELGVLLKDMRALANEYIVPEDGCQSFELLYKELEALEQDTHLHIYKENNLLFTAIA